MRFVVLVLALAWGCFVTGSPSPSAKLDFAQLLDSDHCTWYGQCGVDSKGKMKNCVSNITAPLLIKQPNGKEALETLKKVCPWMYSGDQTTRTCCDYKQLDTLDESIRPIYSLVGSCPSCSYSLMKVFCSFTCSPMQSRFMRAQKTIKLKAGLAIAELEVRVADKYKEVLYDSCKSVDHGNALKALCQGAKCSPSLLLKGLGMNPLAPFPINFTSDEGAGSLTPQDFGAVPCSEAPPLHPEPCTCADCPQRKQCHAPPKVAPKAKFSVTIDGVTFIMACLYVAFLLLFVGALAFCGEKPNSKAALHEPEVVLKVYSLSWLSKFACRLQLSVEGFFKWWCYLCARNSGKVIIGVIAMVAVASSGIAVLKVTSDPVKLWSAPDSEVRKEKNIFDSNFGPFYRTAQLVVTVNNLPKTFRHVDINDDYDYQDKTTRFGFVLNKNVMEKVLELQLLLMNMNVPYRNSSGHNKNITLEDVCFKPLSPYNDHCAIMSVFQYFQNDQAKFEETGSDGFNIVSDYLDHIKTCTDNAFIVDSAGDFLHLSCLGDYGGPSLPNVVLGGYTFDNHTQAQALVITFVVSNHVDESKNAMAEAWEEAFLERVASFDRGLTVNYTDSKNVIHTVDTTLNIAYSAERSVKDEVSRESKSDVLPIVVSYCIMFIYVAVFLGQCGSKHTSPLRFILDTKVFLALAGVLLVIAAISCSLGIFAFAGVEATLIVFEVVPFLVLAVGVDNIFLMFQTLQRDARLDHEDGPTQVGRVIGSLAPGLTLTALSESIAFFCGAFSSMPAVKTFSLFAGLAILLNFLLQMTIFVAFLALDKARPLQSSPGVIYCVIKSYFAPLILSKYARPLVMALFVGALCGSIAATTKLDVGLAQSTPLPKDSYLVNYFDNLTTYLKVGPPVYFVVDGEYPYDEKEYQSRVCSLASCSNESLSQLIADASTTPKETSIALPAMSWVDDYLTWISPLSGCCRHYDDSPQTFCNASMQHANCSSCLQSTAITKNDFDDQLQNFLSDNPTRFCPKAGHAAYGQAVNFVKGSKSKIRASYFMSYHTILGDSEDFISALTNARKLADRLTKALGLGGVRVFPYSVFYVFYDQYLTIVHDAVVNLSISALALFAVSFVLLYLRLIPALLILITVVMVMIDVMGVMYVWGIKFNAISLVNLVVAMGIGVEFCGHVIIKFSNLRTGTKIERASEALVTTGSSVFSGITLTKFAGVVILAFTKSKLFQVYYFRMYLSIVLVGAAHGLIFVPVLLSYIGPKPAQVRVPRRNDRAVFDTERKPLLTAT